MSLARVLIGGGMEHISLADLGDKEIIQAQELVTRKSLEFDININVMV